MESTMLTKTRFTSFYSFSTNYVLKRFLYLLIPLFLLSNVDVNAQCTGVITGQTGSMNVSLNALGTATVQVGTHVAGFGFPANSITGTIGISAPTCVTPTYQVYEKNGANLGPLVANGSAATIAFNCSDLGANTYYLDNLQYSDLPRMSVVYGTSLITNATTTKFNMGSVAVGAKSSVLTFTVKNTGLNDLLLSGTPKIAITGANASEFSIDEFTSRF